MINTVLNVVAVSARFSPSGNLIFQNLPIQGKKKLASYVKMLSDKSGFYVETRTLIAYLIGNLVKVNDFWYGALQ